MIAGILFARLPHQFAAAPAVWAEQRRVENLQTK